MNWTRHSREAKRWKNCKPPWPLNALCDGVHRHAHAAGLGCLETIERLWQVDPKLQVALCTAYTDYSWEDIDQRLGLTDGLLILKKPFDAIEIRQMASALTVKWQMTEDAALKMTQLELAVQERTRELSDANIIVQNSPTILYRLRGDPSFKLMYISHNITRYGHVAADLVASANWAQDLIHPDDQAGVDAAMARVLDRHALGASIEFRLRTGEGTWRWVENRYVPVRDHDGRLLEVEGIILDITERRVAEEKLALLARTDGLTGLANRATLIERLHQAFAGARRGAAPFAVFYLDLDHFKRINDSLGHPIGDLLLQEVARRIKSSVRETTSRRAWAATNLRFCNWTSATRPVPPPWPAISSMR